MFILLSRCREPAQILLVSEVVVRAVVGTVLHSTVVHRGGGRGRLLSTPLLTLVQLPEGSPELLGHEVVDDGVDGTVQVDAEAAEEEEPGVEVRRVHKGVHHHQRAVGQPQHGKESHHHCQHLGHLDRGDAEREMARWD